MKKVAVIGTSNVLLRTGFGAMLKLKYGDQCDLYAIGSSTSLLAVYFLLARNILDNYEYVFLDFNINETDCLQEKSISVDAIISYWAFILNLLVQSKSRPYILILPYRKYNYKFSSSYIQRAMARIFNTDIIDIEKDFLQYSDSALSTDGAHYFENHQRYIADRLAEVIEDNENESAIQVNLPTEKINFFLENFDNYHTPKVSKGTSIIKEDVYHLTDQTQLKLDTNRYVCGILFWVEGNMPFIKFSNEEINIVKNLNIHTFDKLFMCRDVGWSLVCGLKNASVVLSNTRIDMTYEFSSHENIRRIGQDPLYVANIILSDLPVNVFGKNIHNYYGRIFQEEYDYLQRGLKNEKINLGPDIMRLLNNYVSNFSH